MFNPNKIPNQASLACQVQSVIRYEDELPYKEMTQIFKHEIPYDENKHRRYSIGFFDECHPSLVLKYMHEHNISREEIVQMLDLMPPIGGPAKFRRYIEDGMF